MATDACPQKAPIRSLLAGVSQNSLALARALLGEGSEVTVAALQPGDAALEPTVHELRAAGVEFCEFMHARDFDVLFVEGYGGNLRELVDNTRRRGALVSTLADYVFTRAQIPTAGVTGTAGKTTVSSLLDHLLRESGIGVHMTHDQGPETSLGPNYELVESLGSMLSGVVVAELAAQRLAVMNTSPNIAIVTSIAPDHAEDFGSFEAYVDAKRTIVRHQLREDWAVLPDREDVMAHFAPFARSRIATFGSSDNGRDTAVFVRGDKIVGRLFGTEFELGSAPTDPIALDNSMAACAGALLAGAEPAAVSASLPRFPGMRFRRQQVCDEGGILAINDALATTPSKARAGIETLGRSVVWIAGGSATMQGTTYDPNDPALVDLELLASAARGRVRVAFVFGPTGPLLRHRLLERGIDALAAPDLDSAVTGAVSVSRPGDIILFAPGMYVPPELRPRFDVLVREGLLRKAQHRAE